MNFKVLLKTLTPSKNGCLAVFSILLKCCSILAFVVVPVAIAFGIAFAFNYVIVMAFGEAMADALGWSIIIAGWSWWLIIDPLYNRYKKIKLDLEK